MTHQAVTRRFSTRPLYLQVRDALADRISTNQWKPRSALPNEGDLAREFGVSSGTMRKALDLLETERLLTRRQGRGTFVNDQAAGELGVRYSNIRVGDGEHVGGEVRLLDVVTDAPNQTECARLRVRMHEQVYRIRRVRLSDGRPFMVEHVSMPAAMFPGLTDDMGFSHRIVVLAQQFGILLGKGEERVTLGMASDEVVKALQLPLSKPVLVLDRIVHNLDGRPVEWRLGHCDISDKYYFAEFR